MEVCAQVMLVGLGLWMADVFVRAVLADRAVAAFRERTTTAAGAGMTRIDALQTRVIDWRVIHKGRLFDYGPDEYTLHAGEAFIARYWLTPFGGNGEFAEMETSEGRWRCTRRIVMADKDGIQITRAENRAEGGSAEFSFGVDRLKNQISAIEFPGRSITKLRYEGGQPGFHTKKFDLRSGDGALVPWGDAGTAMAEMHERAWASGSRRDIILMGCYAVMDNWYNYEDISE